VPLPKFAIDELRAWKRQQAERLLRLGVRQKQDGLVCAREDGEPKQPASLTNEFTYLEALSVFVDLNRSPVFDGGVS
jgi:hypothetical protein